MWTQMGLEENPILTSSLLTDLSTHYDYVVSHVVLRWAIHKNVTVIPRSASENHIAQNIRSLDISLSKYDIAEVDSMATIMDDMLSELYDEMNDTKADAGGNAAVTAGDPEHKDLINKDGMNVENTAERNAGDNAGNVAVIDRINEIERDTGSPEDDNNNNDKSALESSFKNPSEQEARQRAGVDAENPAGRISPVTEKLPRESVASKSNNNDEF